MSWTWAFLMTVVLQQSDFTYLGSFAIPRTSQAGVVDNAFANCGFTAISATRMFFQDGTAVANTPAGPHVNEIAPPAQASWTKVTPYPAATFNTGTVANGDWGFLNSADFHTVWNAPPVPPNQPWSKAPGAGDTVLAPVYLFWDDVNSWMWTVGSVSYDATAVNMPNHFASTLSGVGGTSKGYWQTAPASTLPTDTAANGSTAHLQKIMSGMFRVPDYFAAAHSVGKLGMGCGGFCSVYQNGSMGPTAFAFTAPSAGTNTTPPAAQGGSSAGTLITTTTLLSYPELNLPPTGGATSGWAKRRNDYWCPQHVKATITVTVAPTGATFNLAALINGTSYTSSTYTTQAGQSTTTVATNWTANIAAANWPIASVTSSGAVITILGYDIGDTHPGAGYNGDCKLTVTVGANGTVAGPVAADDGVNPDGSTCLADQNHTNGPVGQQSVNPTGGYGGSPGTGKGVGYWTWNQTGGPSIWIQTSGGKEGYIVFGLEPTGNIQYDISHVVTPSGSQYYAWRIYDPADLAAVAAGTKNCYVPDAAVYFRPADIAGFGPAEYTRGVPFADAAETQHTGAWYDPVTGYLYLCVSWQEFDSGSGNRYPLVHVFAVNQNPPGGTKEPARFVSPW